MTTASAPEFLILLSPSFYIEGPPDISPRATGVKPMAFRASSVPFKTIESVGVILIENRHFSGQVLDQMLHGVFRFLVIRGPDI